jgi:phosphoenolpyruvate carboxylase
MRRGNSHIINEIRICENHIYQRLDIREQVEKHEHDIQELKKALDLA